MVNMKIKGATYGFAYGDSWGKDPEFQSHETLIRTNPPFPQKAFITDDTQMSLYTLYGVMFEVENQPSLLQGLQHDAARRATIRTNFADSFTEWLHDPDNDRAPGATCLRALKAYEWLHKEVKKEGRKVQGDEGCDSNSKGCGANMRVGWLGLLPLHENDIINLSILQSETTHGHPLALSSSVLTALAVKAIYDGEITSGTGSYFTWLENKTSELIDDLLLHGQKAPGSWSMNYRAGLTEMQRFLEKTREFIPMFLEADDNADICYFFGGGWVAEEALVLALIAADYLSTDPVKAVRRLVLTSGDSDSIAAIGGMFVGAEKSFTAFPAEWEDRFEQRYTDELQEVTQFLTRVN
jgi:ADP-ribosylglycohydrolase